MELELDVVLEKSELFSQLNRESFELISRHFKRVTFENGSIICREGDIGASMFVILSGKVSVLRDMGWGERELGIMEYPDVFGEMALLTEETRSATVVALEKTDCLQLDNVSFGLLLDQDPVFAQQVAKFMTKRFSKLTRKTSDELLGAYRALMFAIADLTDSRDPETVHILKEHETTVLYLLTSFQSTLSLRIKYPRVLLKYLSRFSLHDVGKVAVPDAILQKPGRLTPEEYEIMKIHSVAGAEAFEKVLNSVIQSYSAWPTGSACIIMRSGRHSYPMKLSGNDIPLEARIMAFADVYDALCSKRVYKRQCQRKRLLI